MIDEKVIVTEKGLIELQAELDHLINIDRAEYIEDLKAARAQGDLSENADYDAARDRQAQVEARISQLEHMIQNAEVINEAKSTKYVRLGSTVTIEELDTNEVNTYKIVGSVEADPLNGKLSNMTPLAEAILDKKVGTVVEVDVDEPYKVKIISVK
ncbi:MAG: transcription elongation factor GreA [Erysipelotrichaceae bacterium]|nr:transcription elongation factor GreA [Erysipelotrichaceae bacterium]